MTTKAKAPAGPTLLDLAADFHTLFQAIEELDGELTPELAAELEALEFSEASKVDGYRFRRLAQQQEEAHLRAQAKALIERANRLKAAGERLDERLQGYMTFKGVRELAGHSYKAKLVPNTPAVLVHADLAALPADCVRTYPAPPPEPDKVAIKARIKAQADALEDAGNAEGWLHRELRAEDGTVLAALADPTFHVRWS